MHLKLVGGGSVEHRFDYLTGPKKSYSSLRDRNQWRCSAEEKLLRAGESIQILPSFFSRINATRPRGDRSALLFTRCLQFISTFVFGGANAEIKHGYEQCTK